MQRLGPGGRTRVYPDFLMVGAAKSGTTTIFHHLRMHSDIFMPSLKEPWFFAFAGDREAIGRVRRGVELPGRLDEYLALFDEAEEGQVVGEASTVYLYLYQQTIANIQRLHPCWPDVRILIVLRDPVERAWSHYMHEVRDGTAIEPFAALLSRREGGQLPALRDYVAYGLYYRQVEAFMARFARVNVVLFEDLVLRPEETMKGVFRFLDVSADAAIDGRLRANPSGRPRSRMVVDMLVRPSALKDLFRPFVAPRYRLRLRTWALRAAMVRESNVDRSVDVRLRNFYRQDIRGLEGLIGRDLSHWYAGETAVSGV